MKKLTREELNVLIEAIGSWTSRRASGELMETVLSSMIAKDKEQLEKFNKERKNKEAGIKEVKERENEQSILLKAKLIEMKNELDNTNMPTI